MLARIAFANMLLATTLLSTAYGDENPATQKPDSPAVKSARPQLSATQAAAYSYTDVLKYSGIAGSETLDPWDPLSDPLVSNALPSPDYTVDPTVPSDGKRRFNTVQAAVSIAASDSALEITQGSHRKRLYILVKPGIYHELLYIPATPIPITLFGSDNDAHLTKISANLDAAVTGGDYAQRFGAQFAAVDPAIKAMYASLKDRANVETAGTAVAWIKSNGFQARNITFENSYNKDHGDARSECPPGGCGPIMFNGQMQVVHHQAVALMVDGADKVQFENVRFIGYQDTLYLKSSSIGVGARSFFDNSYVEGDVDFIFGDTTAYFYRSEIKSLGDRSTSYVVAPATNYLSKYGFVFNACKFTNDRTANALAGKFYLARQWFHNQRCTPYGTVDVPGYSCSFGTADSYIAPTGTISQHTLEAVGKVVILNSQIGAHINQEHPWSNWNAKGSLAYRPVQYDSDDYWSNLIAAKIDPVHTLGYSAKSLPTTPFLAEFNNSEE
jgi:pectinesterase